MMMSRGLNDDDAFWLVLVDSSQFVICIDCSYKQVFNKTVFFLVVTFIVRKILLEKHETLHLFMYHPVDGSTNQAHYAYTVPNYIK